MHAPTASAHDLLQQGVVLEDGSGRHHVATPLSAPATGPRPQYWTLAKRRLRAADPVLGAIIQRYPRIALRSRGDAFQTLARSIVGQQISVKAADAVWVAGLRRCGEPLTPRALLRRRATTLRGCGLSERKVEYLRDLARPFCRRTARPGPVAGHDRRGGYRPA